MLEILRIPDVGVVNIGQPEPADGKQLEDVPPTTPAEVLYRSLYVLSATLIRGVGGEADPAIAPPADIQVIDAAFRSLERTHRVPLVVRITRALRLNFSIEAPVCRQAA